MANLARPARLQGRHNDPHLAPLGVRQAEAVRDVLAGERVDHCFSSPLLRAVETATIVGAPHSLVPVQLEALAECDVGDWAGLDWESIRQLDPQAYQRFHEDPGTFGYPGGETFAQVHQRAAAALDELPRRHEGKRILVVSHHVVLRAYLAGLLGLALSKARQVTLDNGGISIVTHQGNTTEVTVLNCTRHLEHLRS